MPQLTCTKLTVFTLAAVLIQIIGLSIFVYGFFPVKPALSGVSGLESFYPPGHSGENGSGIDADFPPHQMKSLYQELSGVSPMFDRLILMVIDGLPAEFVLGKDGKPPRRDLVEAMPYIHSLLSTGRAFGYHAKAAPPTVTMPRLKAMVSGAIGGFLDVAFNFNTQALLDDNLLGQFFKIGWKMVMLGDDTWLRLFPGLFARHDGVNSFYVKDIVQVDFNVSRHLGKELISDDWNLLVLHYLGLDHIGHIGGRSSPLMGPKLTEMDEVVKSIHLHAIQTQAHDHERTLLLVVSDHGMTESGNHGGSSYEETDSLALFIGFENEITDQASVTSIHQQSFPVALKQKALLLEFRDATHMIGLAYILFWCLLQVVLQQPINAMPVFLLMLQVFACMFCNSQGERDQMELVEVASLYYMGMAGHFALGNSNTLATIDVAGAFIGLSSHSMFVSGILMFMITYASPLLFLLSLVMYKSVKTTNYLATVQMDDSGEILKLMLGFPCLVPLIINSILLTSYTVVLLLMRNHLFVWSVFSPKYLYVCATSVCVYTAVLVVAVTETYTLLVLTLRRKPGSLHHGDE